MLVIKSEAKESSTENAWTAVNHDMQILGGIGYTDFYSVERLLRAFKLIAIYTLLNARYTLHFARYMLYFYHEQTG
jgi:alkylation response protein AidB-like acyl-CoA dehydrogenase